MAPKTEETLASKNDPAGAESEKKDKEKVSKTEKEPEDLSEEDKKLKEELELCVTRLQDSDDKVLINNKIGSFLDQKSIVVLKIVNRVCNYLLSIIALPRSLGMYAKTYPCIYYINDFGPKAT